MTLGKILRLSISQYPHLLIEYNNSTSTGLLGVGDSTSQTLNRLSVTIRYLFGKQFLELLLLLYLLLHKLIVHFMAKPLLA